MLFLLNMIEKIRQADSEYSEDDIFLKYGLPSLMLYEPIKYKNLIFEINIERDKYTTTLDRMRFISLYKQVYLAQRKKLRKILERIENRTIRIFPEPTRDDIIRFLNDSWQYDDMVSNFENVYRYAATCIKRAIQDTEEEIYLLRHYPFIYYNH